VLVKEYATALVSFTSLYNKNIKSFLTTCKVQTYFFNWTWYKSQFGHWNGPPKMVYICWM